MQILHERPHFYFNDLPYKLFIYRHPALLSNNLSVNSKDLTPILLRHKNAFKPLIIDGTNSLVPIIPESVKYRVR